MQLEAIASRPITSYLGEETNTLLNTTSCQVVVESNKIPPQAPLLQTKEPPFLQPLLVRLCSRPLTSLAALVCLLEWRTLIWSSRSESKVQTEPLRSPEELRQTCAA